MWLKQSDLYSSSCGLLHLTLLVIHFFFSLYLYPYVLVFFLCFGMQAQAVAFA